MPRVLIVDDESGYREELEIALRQAGHEVKAAASGREAIDLGIRYRPEVLVADWMLQDSIHGLHVAAALRVVRPDLQTILITGYASEDLRAEAEKVNIFAFIEKPFHVEQFRQTVQRAADSARPSSAVLPVGIVEVDADGGIQFANAQARDMLAQTPAGRDAAGIAAVLGEGTTVSLAAARTRWVPVSPVGAVGVEWRMRCREWDGAGDRLVVILATPAGHHRQHPAVRMLLGITETAAVRWPLSSRVLIVDGAALVRRAVVSSLEAAGCVCHAADAPEHAIQTLERDTNITAVLLDYDVPADLPAFVGQVRAIRPNATIVGTCTQDRRREFEAMGVRHFLEKPYAITDLINLLTDRIGDCGECGLPIPLRRPRPGETGSSWACCGCGARYHAVFDSDLPHDVLRHVRLVEAEPAGKNGGQ